MNRSLPSAAGVQSAAELVEGVACSRGAAAGGPVAAVVTGDCSQPIRASRRCAAAALPVVAPLSLGTGLSAEVSCTGVGVSPALGRGWCTSGLGRASDFAQRSTSRRSALAARNRHAGVTTSTRCACCGRSPCRTRCATHHGRARYRGHVATGARVATGTRVTANGGIAANGGVAASRGRITTHRGRRAGHAVATDSHGGASGGVGARGRALSGGRVAAAHAAAARSAGSAAASRATADRAFVVRAAGPDAQTKNHGDRN